MTLERIRDAAAARPFRPFRLCLADGRQFPVPSPAFIWVPPQAQRTIHLAGTGDVEHVIDLLLVSSLDFVTQKKPRGGNGPRGPGQVTSVVTVCTGAAQAAASPA